MTVKNLHAVRNPLGAADEQDTYAYLWVIVLPPAKRQEAVRLLASQSFRRSPNHSMEYHIHKISNEIQKEVFRLYIMAGDNITQLIDMGY